LFSHVFSIGRKMIGTNKVFEDYRIAKPYICVFLEAQDILESSYEFMINLLGYVL